MHCMMQTRCRSNICPTVSRACNGSCDSSAFQSPPMRCLELRRRASNIRSPCAIRLGVEAESHPFHNICCKQDTQPWRLRQPKCAESPLQNCRTTCQMNACQDANTRSRARRRGSLYASLQTNCGGVMASNAIQLSSMQVASNSSGAAHSPHPRPASHATDAGSVRAADPRSLRRRSKDFAAFFEKRPEKMLPNMVPGSASSFPPSHPPAQMYTLEPAILAPDPCPRATD